MGGSGLLKAFGGAAKLLSLNIVGANKVLAVDVSILLHKWVFTAGDAALTLGLVLQDNVSPLADVFGEVMEWLMQSTPTLLVVFDGSCPGKAPVNSARAASAQKARKCLLKLQQESRPERAKMLSMVRSSNAPSSNRATTSDISTPLPCPHTLTPATLATLAHTLSFCWVGRAAGIQGHHAYTSNDAGVCQRLASARSGLHCCRRRGGLSDRQAVSGTVGVC